MSYKIIPKLIFIWTACNKPQKKILLSLSLSISPPTEMEYGKGRLVGRGPQPLLSTVLFTGPFFPFGFFYYQHAKYILLFPKLSLPIIVLYFHYTPIMKKMKKNCGKNISNNRY
jgi:hypothetical protein